MRIQRLKHLAIGACFAVLYWLSALSGYAQVDVTGALVGNGSYATLGAAFTAINSSAQGGANIVVTITGNTNEGTASATLNANASPWASLLIQPSGGAWTIAGTTTAGSPLINLNGADNVTIDGLNASGNALTIQNQTVSATLGTSTIQFINGATNNVVTRCFIQGAFAGAAVNLGGNIVFSTDITTGLGNDNNIISNNDIGPYLANLPTQMIFGNGTNTTLSNYNNGITISGNNIHDYFGAAVTSAGMYVIAGCADWTIQNNRFYQTATRSHTTGSLHSAIILAGGNISNTLVSGNIIGYANEGGTGTYTIANGVVPNARFCAINVSAATSVTISGNVITNFSFSGNNAGSGSFAPFIGIAAFATQSTITGNTIGSSTVNGAITYTSSSTVVSEILGIHYSGPSVTTINNAIGGITAGNSSTGAIRLIGVSCGAYTGASYVVQNNQIGGTVTNSLQSTATNSNCRVLGISVSTSSTTVTGNTIENLTAAAGNGQGNNTAVAGVVLNSASGNHVLTGNAIGSITMLDPGSIADVCGILFNGSSGTNLVSKNSIHSLVVTSVNASIHGCYVLGGTCSYSNNMVRLGLDPTGAAIGIGCTINGFRESAGTNNFYHNSVYIGGTGVGGFAPTSALLSTVTNNTRNYRNNIFFNARSNGVGTGSHYAIQVGGSTPNPPGLSSNSNVLYVNGAGGALGRYNLMNLLNLSVWNSFTGQDINSVSVDPNYVLPTGSATTGDLHITSPTIVEGNGQVIATVTDDIDGQARSTLSPTDIGADAGNFVQTVDLLPPTISYTPLTSSCIQGDQTVTATIVDASGVPTTGGLMPRIYFRKNAGAYVSSPGVLTSGNGNSGTWTFTISAAAMGGITGGEQISYFVIAQDVQAIPKIASSPSPGLVASDVNTVTTPPTTPSSYNVLYLFNGTYTVGVGGTFPTLTAAVNAYNIGCLAGPTLFSLLNASYPSETFPITINAHPSASAINTLTIKPTQANTLLSVSSSGPVIMLNGADYVTIDGSIGSTANSGCPPLTAATRDLNIVNVNTSSSAAVIWLRSNGSGQGCTNNVIKNCQLSLGANQSTTAADNYCIISCGSSISIAPPPDGLGNDNNLFENNSLEKAAWGIFLRGGLGASNTGNVIRQNTVGPSAFGANELRRGGIVVQHQTGVVIQSNEVRFVGNAATQIVGGTDHVGIGIGGLDGPSPATTTVSNATVTLNSIHDIICEKTFSAIGIQVSATNSSPTNNLIANNFIYNVHANSTGGNQGIGIGIASGNGDHVVHNTVNMVCADRDPGAAAMASESDCGVRIQSAALNLSFRDNLIHLDESSSSTTVKNFAIVAPSSGYGWGAGGCDFNDYSINPSGSQNQQFGLGTTGTINTVSNLATWRTTFLPNQDANSVQITPGFASGTDLHLVPGLNSALDNLGSPVAGVTTDYDCQVRSAVTPDIGADEYDVTAPVITYTPLPITCSNGDRTITATIMDADGVPTSGPLQPRVYYKKNAGAYISSAGTLVSGTGTNGTWTFTLSAAGMGGLTGGDVITYYVVAEDILPIPNVGSNPAIGFVGTSVNNVVSPPSAPNTTTVGTNMSGTYTVGLGGDFPTLTAAVNAYNIACLQGPVLLSLIDAAYTSETYPITIGANAGASSTNTLTIKPAAGVSPGFNGSTTLLLLNGADYVTIDGSNGSVANSICPRDTATRDLILNGSGAAFAQVALCTTPAGDPATHNRVMNCRLMGNGYSVHTGGPTVGLGTGANGNDFNEIVNNQLDRRLFASGTSTLKNEGNVYSLNWMRDRVEILYENAPTVHANRVGNRSTSGDVVGISLGYPGGSISNSISTGQEVTNASVMYNLVDLLQSTNRQSAGGICLAATSTGTTTIANNIISRIGTDPVSPDIGAGILWGGGAGTLRVWYNTVNVTNPSGSSLSSNEPLMALGVMGSAPSLDARNNIFHGNSPFAPQTTSINLGYTSTVGNYANLLSDYNDLTTTSSVTGRTVSLSSSGTSWATLSAWQSQTGRDGNSIRVLPNFVSASDLHLPSATNPGIENRGIPLTITTDFDCESRDPATPDMGADETQGCTTVDAGTISGPIVVCSGGTVTFTGTGYSSGQVGFTWQSAPFGSSNWTNTGGTNPASFTTGPITANTSFRLRAACSSNNAVDSSNVVTVIVSPSITPTVSISVSPGNSGCPGTSFSFSTSVTNAGSSPTYQWKVNGSNVGTNSPAYSSATLADGDQVTCVVTSSATCAAPSTVTSNAIVMSLLDAIAPTAACQNLTVALDNLGNGSILATAANNGSSDNCTAQGSLAFSIPNATFSCSDLGSNLRTLTVTDLSGNTGTCGLTVTVVDLLSPTAICQNLTVALDGSGNASITPTQVNNASTDNCTAQNALSISLSGSSFNCSHVGSNQRTLTVTDAQGNSSTCTAAIQVIDNLPPLATCQSITVGLNGAGFAGVAAASILSSGTDNCTSSPDLVLNLSPTDFICSNLGNNAVTLSVTDQHGNTTSCTATVTITDPVAPLAQCQNVTLVLDPQGSASLNTTQVDNGSVDNCSATLSLSATAFGCGDVGNNLVTLTVTDGSGNTASCNAIVAVADTFAPTALCQNLSLSLGPNGIVSISAGAVDVGSSDACGIAQMTLDQSLFDCGDLGANPVILTVTDSSGNASTCSATITLQGTALSSSASVTPMDCGFDISCAGVSDGSATATATGGCPPYSYSWSNGASTPTATGLPAGTHTVTITDAGGSVLIDTVTLTQPPPLLAPLGAVQASCAGNPTGSADIQPTGGNSCHPYSYLWNNGDTLQDLTAAGPGNYMLIVTDAQGCTALQAVTIGTVSAPVPTFTQVGHQLISGQTWATYQWLLNGIPLSGADASIYDILVQGTYALQVTDSNGCIGTSSPLVVVGIEDAMGSWVVYPNPTRDRCHVTTDQPATEGTKVRLTDMLGRVMLEQEFPVSETTMQMDLRGYAAGIYWLEINALDGERKAFRLVVE